jgi:hypothetical protein
MYQEIKRDHWRVKNLEWTEDDYFIGLKTKMGVGKRYY